MGSGRLETCWAPEPIVWRLESHEHLPSTSTACIARAAAGEKAGLALLARRQSAGRGSRGRSWACPPGNLALSVLIRPPTEARDAGLWALLAGVAVAETADAYLARDGISALRLKWPNDVFLNDAKLAGVLIDFRLDHGSGSGGIAWIVIGIGVNLAHAPALAEQRTACLAQGGMTPPTPEAFARQLLDTLGAWHDRLARGQTDLVRAAWLRRGAPLGTRLGATQGQEHVSGMFAGLTPQGHLMLDTASGRVTLTSGALHQYD